MADAGWTGTDAAMAADFLDATVDDRRLVVADGRAFEVINLGRFDDRPMVQVTDCASGLTCRIEAYPTWVAAIVRSMLLS
jgi:hypothetical protein